MSSQAARLDKLFLTLRTRVRLLSGVTTNVFAKAIRLSKFFYCSKDIQMVFRPCVSLRVSSNVLIYGMFYHSENRRMASPRCVYEGVFSAEQAESTTVHSVYIHVPC